MGRKQEKRQRAAGHRGACAIVAIVGRPNVGKSALFNRLTESRMAIVEDVAGVTRDRLYADASARGKDYVLVDTGGLDPYSDDPMRQSIANNVRAALSEADVIICVLDGTEEPQLADREAVRLLRETQKPVIHVANKIDNARASHAAMELYRLGIKDILMVSALHGHGIGDLEDQLAKLLPKTKLAPEQDDDDEYFDDEADESDDSDESGEHDEEADREAKARKAANHIPRIAIVGRPNAGKSSLVNKLLGAERQIVDSRPGTTVDSIDTLVEWKGQRFILVDTAGIRRKRAVEKGIEALSVMQAIRAVERCDVVILLIDGADGAAEQDTKIAGLAMERGRALVIGLNKMDLLDDDGRKQSGEKARDVFNFAPWATLQHVSVKTGRGVTKLMEAVVSSREAHTKRVTTGQANKFFAAVLQHHPPPTSGSKAPRLYYITQASTRPPTFVIQASDPEAIHFSYQRYVANQIRDHFGFHGTPLRVIYRKKKRRGDTVE